MNAQILFERVGPPYIPDDELVRMAGGPPSIMAQAAAFDRVQKEAAAQSLRRVWAIVPAMVRLVAMAQYAKLVWLGEAPLA